MPDVAIMPLAILGLVVAAGGSGWLISIARGKRKKNDE